MQEQEETKAWLIERHITIEKKIQNIKKKQAKEMNSYSSKAKVRLDELNTQRAIELEA